jgi:3-hydroxy-3-methylglutaryl CoA synthase
MTTQNEHGILATSRYVPRMRMERSEIYAQHRWMAPGLRSLAKGQKAMANWDEDSVTMAFEAARALDSDLTQVNSLTLSSTSLPFAERTNAGIVASALNLSTNTLVRDVSSSYRAACTELLTNLMQAPKGFHLIAASEKRSPKPASTSEMIQGDGAAAVLTGTGPVIARLVASHTEYADFVDHFRENGQSHEYGWEERWTRDEGYLKIAVRAIQKCLEQHSIKATDISHFVMPAVLTKINEVIAKKVGISQAAITDTHRETVGDLGSAQPLAMLDTALRQAKAEELILLTCFGSGCDVLILQRTSLPCPGNEPQHFKSENSYLKYLAFNQQIELDWGMRAEMDNKTALTAAWRDHARISHFEGGQCKACGTVQFPSGRLCVNPQCNAQDSQTPYSLVDEPAHILSHTSDFLAYTPHPPFQFGHIDFKSGARVLMEFTDTDQEELNSNLPVRMVYRIKEFDAKRGFRRYFWKATPIRNHSQNQGT